MLSAVAANYKIDSFIYPLNAYYGNRKHQDKDLSRIVQSVETMIKQFANNDIDVTQFANKNLDVLFDFRINALKWAIDNGMQIGDFETLVANNFEQIENDSPFAVLFENVLFSIRTNMRAINSLPGAPQSGVGRKSIDFSAVSEIPKQSFTSFINLISFTTPESIFSSVVDWLIASLHIEFGIIAFFIIYKENLSVGTEKISELATFVANSAQDFGAITREMYPKKKRENKNHPLSLSNEHLAEEYQLSEQDIESLRDL